MSDFHKNAGNNAAEMHGLKWRTVADAPALAALNIVTADVDQARLVFQTDSGQYWLPLTTGTGATFIELFTSASLLAGLNEVAVFGCSTTDVVQAASGTTVIGTAPFSCRNIAWPAASTAKLIVNGFEMRCSGTFDTTNMPAGGYSSGPTAGGNGAAATTGGTAGATLSTLVAGGTTGGATGGTAGGTGTTTAGGQAAAATALTTFGSGGASGASGTGGGSGASGGSNTGGLSRSGSACAGARDFVAPPLDMVMGGITAAGAYNVQQGGVGGPGGGAGAGDGTTAGPGGGGGGAGAIPTVGYMRKCVLSGSTPVAAFSARGSNGGNGGTPAGGNRGGAGGGSGGGGGYLILVVGEFIGSATNCFDASGGDGGAGGNGTGTGTGGNGGAGGTGGKIVVFELKSRTRKVSAAGSGGAAGGVASGTTGGTSGAGEILRMSWP